MPRASGAEASTDQVPLVKRVVVSVWMGVPVAVDPAKIFTVTVSESAAVTSATPAKCGRVSSVELPFGGVDSVTTGGMVSPAFARW